MHPAPDTRLPHVIWGQLCIACMYSYKKTVVNTSLCLLAAVYVIAPQTAHFVYGLCVFIWLSIILTVWHALCSRDAMNVRAKYCLCSPRPIGSAGSCCSCHFSHFMLPRPCLTHSCKRHLRHSLVQRFLHTLVVARIAPSDQQVLFQLAWSQGHPGLFSPSQCRSLEALFESGRPWTRRRLQFREFKKFTACVSTTAIAPINQKQPPPIKSQLIGFILYSEVFPLIFGCYLD